MEIKASVKNLRMSPRKVRLVADLVRDKPVKIALHDLQFCSKRAALPMTKLIKSAMANASHNLKVSNKDDLKVVEIRVDEAPSLKRWRFVSRGRIHQIRKRASHVSLILKSKE